MMLKAWDQVLSQDLMETWVQNLECWIKLGEEKNIGVDKEGVGEAKSEECMMQIDGKYDNHIEEFNRYTILLARNTKHEEQT